MPHYLNKVLATPGTLIFFFLAGGGEGGGGGRFKDFLRVTLVFLTPVKVLNFRDECILAGDRGPASAESLFYFSIYLDATVFTILIWLNVI